MTNTNNDKRLVRPRSMPAERMTAADRRAFAQGRAEISRGEFVTLEELKRELASDRRKERA